jgi:hypothetical protein
VGIYRENLPPTHCQTSGRPATLAYVWWFLHSGPKSVSYIQVLPKGYSKSSIRLIVWFAERTSGGPPSYVSTIDNSIRLPNLAYVHLLRIMFGFYFLKVQSVFRLTLKVLGLV